MSVASRNEKKPIAPISFRQNESELELLERVKATTGLTRTDIIHLALSKLSLELPEDFAG